MSENNNQNSVRGVRKHRGKRYDGVWCTGNANCDYDGIPRSISDYCGSNPVDAATVGEFTNLTDTQKTEIFEDDIMRVKIGNNDPVIGVVAMKMGAFGIAYTEDGEIYFTPFISMVCLNPFMEIFEIIGNIHDDRDLYEKHCSFVTKPVPVDASCNSKPAETAPTGRYSGFDDKNGKKICEHDAVAGKQPGKDIVIGRAAYKDNVWGILWEDMYAGGFEPLVNFDPANLAVIDNTNCYDESEVPV